MMFLPESVRLFVGLRTDDDYLQQGGHVITQLSVHWLNGLLFVDQIKFQSNLSRKKQYPSPPQKSIKPTTLKDKAMSAVIFIQSDYWPRMEVCFNMCFFIHLNCQ